MGIKEVEKYKWGKGIARMKKTSFDYKKALGEKEYRRIEEIVILEGINHNFMKKCAENGSKRARGRK